MTLRGAIEMKLLTIGCVAMPSVIDAIAKMILLEREDCARACDEVYRNTPHADDCAVHDIVERIAENIRSRPGSTSA